MNGGLKTMFYPKVATITHFYTRLLLYAWFGCGKKLQSLGKLQLVLGVVTSGCTAVLNFQNISRHDPSD